jgi:hypothetical protein
MHGREKLYTNAGIEKPGRLSLQGVPSGTESRPDGYNSPRYAPHGVEMLDDYTPYRSWSLLTRGAGYEAFSAFHASSPSICLKPVKI